MRPISPRVKKLLLADPRMKECALVQAQSLYGACSGRIEWDHVWIYAGAQIDEPWAIVGLCHKHHATKDGNRGGKSAIERASLLLATQEDLARYPRKPWGQIRKALGMKRKT